MLSNRIINERSFIALFRQVHTNVQTTACLDFSLVHTNCYNVGEPFNWKILNVFFVDYICLHGTFLTKDISNRQHSEIQRYVGNSAVHAMSPGILSLFTPPLVITQRRASMDKRTIEPSVTWIKRNMSYSFELYILTKSSSKSNKYLTFFGTNLGTGGVVQIYCFH